MNQRTSLYSALVVLGVAAVLSGCGTLIPGKVTGGGYVTSFTGSGNANFGFSANACDPDRVKGTFTFQDKAAGVKLSGTITRAGKCVYSGNSTSNCCFANGGTGCDDQTCQASVCAGNSFCCDTEWDAFCAAQANANPNCPCGGGGGGFDCACPPEIAFSDGDFNDLYYAELTYRNTNPKVPCTGTGCNGTAIACADDNGEGNKADAKDIVSLSIFTGPYNGYFVLDDLSGGNLQGHSCK